jgi:hypothetical protein
MRRSNSIKFSVDGPILASGLFKSATLAEPVAQCYAY